MSLNTYSSFLAVAYYILSCGMWAKRIVTSKGIPYGEFETEKKLPSFYGWNCYPNLPLKSVKSFSNSSNHRSYKSKVHPNVLSVMNS